MLDNFTTFLKKKGKKEPVDKSKNAAKERLHLVLMQDRANVSADFLEMMKQEIVDVVKKYIDVDETDMDVKLENRINNDGTSGAPALYANIPIVGINEEKKKESEEIGKAKKDETLIPQKETKERKTRTTATAKKGTATKKAASTVKSATTRKTTATKKTATTQVDKQNTTSATVKTTARRATATKTAGEGKSATRVSATVNKVAQDNK